MTASVSPIGQLPLPEALRAAIPLGKAQEAFVAQARQTLRGVITREDPRRLCIVGPCSVHDLDAVVEYAQKLAALARQVQDTIYIVMRTYFDKPRTALGWRGLILDPHLDGSFDIGQGLRWARQCLRAVLSLGVPTAAEVVDPLTSAYIQDALCWAGVGARTVESPVHRQLASGLPMPVGFKNAMDGHVMAAIHAMLVAQRPQTFLGLDDKGQPAVLQSMGNPCVHLVLRGGRGQGNADEPSVAAALSQLVQAGLPAAVLIDCAHGNSGKLAQGQISVFEQALLQMHRNPAVLGLMLESHLHEGRQPLATDDSAALQPLAYGVSISDPCLGWEQTEALILRWHHQLRLSCSGGLLKSSAAC